MSKFGRIFGFRGINCQRSTDRQRHRLELEPLESRLVLSTFTVTNTAGDNSPGSLRAEVQAAQAAGSGNEVNFAASLAGAAIDLNPSLGPIIVNNPSLTITGASLSKPVAIDGGGSFGTLVFSVQGGTANFTSINIQNGVGAIQNGGTLSLSNVNLTADNGPMGQGAVYNIGSLTVTNGVVSNCANGGFTNFGTTFAVTGTHFASDGSTAISTMEGGTIKNINVTGSGNAMTDVAAVTAGGNGNFSLSNSTLSGNAFALSDVNAPSFTVTGTTITGNQIGVRILASQYDTATLSEVTISHSTANALIVQDYGNVPGGLVTVTDCSISNNSGGIVAASEGDTVFSFDNISQNTMTGAAAALSFEPVSSGDKCVVSATTIDHNTGNSTTGSDGGGVGAFAVPGTPGSLYLTNSTILDNTAYGYGGGVYADGPVSVTIAASTITGNAADNYQFGKGTGGGIAQLPGSTVTLTNTIDALNTAQTASPDFYGKSTASTYNLIGNDTGSSGWGAHNLLGTASNPINPKLDAPAYNGGPNTHVLTLAVQPGSPAINFGNGLVGFTDETGGVRTDETIGALDQVKADPPLRAASTHHRHHEAVDLAFLHWDHSWSGWHHRHSHHHVA